MKDHILDLPMPYNDAEAPTIREYFKAIAGRVWKETEGFSGKRPFGNSCWFYYVYTALAQAKLIAAVLDEDGNIDDISNEQAAKADRMVAEAIKRM